MNNVMVIKTIVREGDRVLLYAADLRHHIIASLAQAADLHEGDTVLYEPRGVNFGWFLRRVEQEPH